jgi:hypothetical protein
MNDHNRPWGARMAPNKGGCTSEVIAPGIITRQEDYFFSMLTVSSAWLAKDSLLYQKSSI